MTMVSSKNLTDFSAVATAPSISVATNVNKNNKKIIAIIAERTVRQCRQLLGGRRVLGVQNGAPLGVFLVHSRHFALQLTSHTNNRALAERETKHELERGDRAHALFKDVERVAAGRRHGRLLLHHNFLSSSIGDLWAPLDLTSGVFVLSAIKSVEKENLAEYPWVIFSL